MKQKKRSYTGRLFYDFRGLERTLEDMARKGWKLKRLNNYYLEYERIAPQELHYTVTYFDEASEFRPTPTENQQVFVDYCAESGWELVAKWAQMLIFCTADPQPTPIDTDPVQQLNTMHKTMKKGMLPSCYMQIFTFLLLIASRIYSAWSMPEYFYSSVSNVCMAGLFLMFLAYTIAAPLRYFAWHRKAVQAVEEGEDIPSPRQNPRLIKVGTISLFVAAAVCLLLQMAEMKGSSVTIYLLLFGFMGCVWFVTTKLQKSGLLAKVWVRVVVVLGVTVASTAIMTSVIFTLILTGRLDFSEDNTADVPLPLSLADFTDADLTGYEHRNDVRESFLLKWSNCHQRSEDYNLPYLDYEVFETDYAFVRDHLFSDMTKLYSNEKHLPPEYQTNWRAVEVPGTTAAYQCYRGDESYGYDYILCYGYDLVEIRFDSELTQAQVDAATQILADALL